MLRKEERTEARTAERCGSCGRRDDRPYAAGDAVLAPGKECSCGGQTSVEMIYARKVTGRRS